MISQPVDLLEMLNVVLFRPFISTGDDGWVLMDESCYRDLLGVTEEIEELLGQEDYDERLTPLLAKRQEIFGRLEDVPLEKEYAVLLRRIRVSEDKCMALAQDKLNKVQGELLAMSKGKKAMAAYGKQL